MEIGQDKDILLLQKKHPELSLKEAGFFLIANKLDRVDEYIHLKKHYLDNCNETKELKDFIDTNCYDFDDNDGWTINTKYCDPSFDNKVIIKATLQYLENQFYPGNYAYERLKNGINVTINMEGFSLSIVKWSLVKQGNILLSAYPFTINRIIVKNPPKYVSKLYFLAKRIFNKDAYQKIEMQS